MVGEGTPKVGYIVERYKLENREALWRGERIARYQVAGQSSGTASSRPRPVRVPRLALSLP